MYTRRDFNHAEIALSDDIRSKLCDVENLLSPIPNCCEKSIAMSHIEDAMLHINVAIAETGISGGENNEVNHNDQ